MQKLRSGRLQNDADPGLERGVSHGNITSKQTTFAHSPQQEMHVYKNVALDRISITQHIQNAFVFGSITATGIA